MSFPPEFWEWIDEGVSPERLEKVCKLLNISDKKNDTFIVTDEAIEMLKNCERAGYEERGAILQVYMARCEISDIARHLEETLVKNERLPALPLISRLNKKDSH